MDHIKVSKVDNVRLIDRYNTKNSNVGTLYLTATHLIFVETCTNKETWILYMHIANVEKMPLSTTGSPLIIRCKTFLSLTFVICKDSECHDVFISLQKLCQPTNIERLYCFNYSPGKEVSKSEGWNYFNLQDEFNRLKVPSDEWILCTINQNYELCDTYPRHIYVPAGASAAILIGSSRFRSRGRLPALTYLHSNKASISRCSQPLSGFSARCLEDEQMLEAIRKTNPNVDYMHVVDTRPRINAMANRATGKGYENEAFYENIKFQFFGIENIHVMRASLQKLVETCEQKVSTMSAFFSSLESSGWLKHIRSILDTSSFIANEIDKGVSAVVHCSDGWDRTAQVCSLSALLLDPYYRTIKGFQALIEKDWLAFGHKFSERCGHTKNEMKEVSPVFTQFLDCTWQLMTQQKYAFEFNETFLLILHDHVHSCQFGTFIGNCEKDRLELKLSERTYSLWSFMEEHLNDYKNPLYMLEMKAIIKPELSPQSIRFWRGMYSRFETGVLPRESLDDILLASRDHTSSLEEHVRHLIKKTDSFKQIILKAAKKIIDPTYDREIINAEIHDRCSYEKQDGQQNSAELPRTNLHPNVLKGEIASVAIDWKSLRSISVCSCSTPFDQFSKKCHCVKCGGVFCTRCIEKPIALSGHDSTKPVPVCRPCNRLIQQNSP